jgi:hypothetical protein
MSNRHERHSFLGERSEEIIKSIRCGIVGVNGGGSHGVQQFGHIGFRRFVIYDPGNVDTESNLSRNVISTLKDFERRAPKVDLAERKLQSIVGRDLELEPYPCRWQERPEPLATCDLIVGGVDTFKVILSMPGSPCMWCLGFLTEERLALEAARYGDVGGRPQVVWANGVLASTAVGIAIDLFCDWTGTLRKVVHLSYDGNSGCVTPHTTLPYVDSRRCAHYPLSDIGPPRYDPL